MCKFVKPIHYFLHENITWSHLKELDKWYFHILKVVDNNKLLVEQAPRDKQEEEEFIFGDKKKEMAVLSPRWIGCDLVPAIEEWPCPTNKCKPIKGGDWESGPYCIESIGDVMRVDKEDQVLKELNVIRSGYIRMDPNVIV